VIARICAAQATSALDREFRAIVGVDGEIGRDQRRRGAASDRAGMMEDIVDLHVRRVGIAEYCHSKRIPDQEQIETRFIKDPCRSEVIGGQRANSAPGSFPAADRIRGNLVHGSDNGKSSRKTSPGSSSSASRCRTECI
jgi:hypothetical protein